MSDRLRDLTPPDDDPHAHLPLPPYRPQIVDPSARWNRAIVRVIVFAFCVTFVLALIDRFTPHP